MSKLEDGFIDDSNFKQLWNEMHSDLLKNDFYGQILLIADKRWCGQKVEEVEFSASYPSFSVINKQQFRFYLYYRTQMLALNYIMPTHISYIFVFMYEILTGAESIEIEIINSILNLNYSRHSRVSG